jgi:hypothetical protein
MAAAAGWVRLAMVEVARNVLPPDEPEVLRALAAATWRMERAGRPERHAALVAAARESFSVSSRTAEALAREAQDVDLQRRLEELILGRMEPWWLDRYVRVEGLPESGTPALFVGLGAPHPLVAVVALAAARRGLCALHPPLVVGEGRADRLLGERFTVLRERVPALWTSRSADAIDALREGRSVHATLVRDHAGAAAGDPQREIEGGAVLGAPWRTLTASARACGAEVRAVEVHRQRDKRWCVAVSPPLPDPELAPRLAAHLQRWPGQNLLWLTPRVDGGHAPH